MSNAPSPRPKRRVRYAGRLARRFPSLFRLLLRLYRRFQGRFTAGVVGVLVDDAGRVLLVEHVFHAKSPWGLPGGWVGRNEVPATALEREFLEETGLVVKTLYPLQVWSGEYWRNHLDMAFAVVLAEPFPEAPLTLSAELLSYCWATPDELPPLLPSHFHVIQLALDYRNGRNRPDAVK
jgi:8-oxo-dGTP pyrophosphatase MutT (NUDIX family)